MKNLIFEYGEPVITTQDIWTPIHTGTDCSRFHSLQESLFEIDLQTNHGLQYYIVRHGFFYDILLGEDGMKNLAFLISKIAHFLHKIQSIGYFYGNVRLENIFVKFDDKKTRILDVKFVNLGTSNKFEDIQEMLIPEQIDHMPPDILEQFLQFGIF